jgi:hypothetical protein
MLLLQPLKLERDIERFCWVRLAVPETLRNLFLVCKQTSPLHCVANPVTVLTLPDVARYTSRIITSVSKQLTN